MTGLRRTRPLRSLYCLRLCLYLYFRRIAPPFQKSRAARSVLCALRSHYPPFSHLPITVGASLELRSSLPVCPSLRPLSGLPSASLAPVFHSFSPELHASYPLCEPCSELSTALRTKGGLFCVCVESRNLNLNSAPFSITVEPLFRCAHLWGRLSGLSLRALRAGRKRRSRREEVPLTDVLRFES
jgi:hypothetical protein